MYHSSTEKRKRILCIIAAEFVTVLSGFEWSYPVSVLLHVSCMLIQLLQIETLWKKMLEIYIYI